ncbi:lysophospholipid acyltransferase family protein [uncultured Nevskia sp.]|uniref:lysophospholipid acyltransferase family protein n=1 Tax=uncultured Nevskia sp. TaxID=228950 RepID=UPI0025E9991C|nr:lysophospholipid acyltransferase family protein [uncultured Nevskia sp.]
MFSLGSLDVKQRIAAKLVTADIEALVASIPKPVGSFGYDPWGYNEDTFKLALGAAKRLYDHYFRVTAHGLENIPSTGRVLIVGNHSGQLPMDGVLVGVAAATNPHGPRLARAMIERFFPTVPWLGNFLNALGGVIGDPVNCSKMLDMDEAIIVYPEGIRGSGKLYRKRYQLQRFGNGFMHLAMNHHAPIVPVGIVGCEETMPAVINLAPIARLLGLPYLPIVPSLLPLPARVYLNFGKPMHFSPAASEAEVTEQVETVKTELRRLMQIGLDERTSLY